MIKHEARTGVSRKCTQNSGNEMSLKKVNLEHRDADDHL